jgi:hypothetical protein
MKDGEYKDITPLNLPLTQGEKNFIIGDTVDRRD